VALTSPFRPARDRDGSIIQGREQLAELRAVGIGAGDLLAIDLLTSGMLQLAALCSEVLGGGPYAGIAVNHARIMHQNCASEKPNRINGPRVMHMS
jgi:hypothetical protein